MTRIVALDTETFLIGPGAIAPKMVCFSTAERDPGDGEIKTTLTGNGDRDVGYRLACLFNEPDLRLVLHNGAYDLTVIATSYPELEPMIWAALEAGRITDTMLREQLLNLSTHGKLEQMFLPDGSAVQLKYNLSVLTLKWLGIDTSHLKEGDDIWRLNYHTLDGLRADQYPRDAQDYAKGDAAHTLQVYEAQEASKEVEGSTETEYFQTAVSFALRWITIEGMPTDPVKFGEMQAMLAEELSEEKLGPLVKAGIMSAREPARPHARQQKKAVEQLREWGVEDFSAENIEAWRAELEGTEIKFKDAVPSGIKTDALKRRVLATQISLSFGESIEKYLQMEVEELAAVAEDSGIPFKRTDSGGVSTDSEVIDDVAEADEVLAVYQHRQSLQKLVSTEIPRMQWDGRLAPRVHWPYKTLLETGRTSSSADKLFPSGNGQQIHPKVRPIFVPPPGYLLCSTDYSTLELACVAQITYEKFGYSVHRDKINAGYDLHAYLGAQLALRLSPAFREMLATAGVNPNDADDCYELFRSLKQDTPDFYKHWRKFAKPIGLGFPGGLGSFKMLSLAKKTYGVDIVAEAEKLFAERPELFDRTSFVLKFHAKRLYDMDQNSTEWTPTLKGIALAKSLRDTWLDTYPEMREYFQYLNDQQDPTGKSRDWIEDNLRSEQSFEGQFSYVSPFGMVRAGCSYTAAANGEAMQTPAAEGFKTAVFHLVKESRIGKLKGAMMVCNEIHDETLTFLKEDRYEELAAAVREIMEGSMAVVLRDVKVTAAPCVMHRWFKEAEPEFDKTTKRLIPWVPKPPKPKPAPTPAPV